MTKSCDMGPNMVNKVVFKPTTLFFLTHKYLGSILSQSCEFSLILCDTHMSLSHIMKLSSHVSQIDATYIMFLEFIQEELPCNILWWCSSGHKNPPLISC